MNQMGDVIWLLMERRGLTGHRLSVDIGISPTPVSKILTAVRGGPAWTYWDAYRHWCSETWWDIQPDGPFYGHLENILKKPIAAFDRFLAQRAQPTGVSRQAPEEEAVAGNGEGIG